MYQNRTNNEQLSAQQAPTGIEGLDFILKGGFPKNHLYLIEGDPGTGKTTLGLQFLLEGKARGESGLYVSLSETRAEVCAVASSHDWDLTGIEVFELNAPVESLKSQSQYTMFHSSEVELTPIMNAVLELVERQKPKRVVFDSLSEMRLLSHDSLKYRRQILALKQFFSGRQATVLLLEDKTGANHSEHHLQSLCHGVIELEQFTLEYGAKRRRANIVKMRGVDFHSGFHDFNIKRGGLVIYPRIVPSPHSDLIESKPVSSGNASLDQLLGGGFDTGTSNLILGSAGTGKTSLSIAYATHAANKGAKVAIFTFDEVLSTLISRAERMGFNLRGHMETGAISVRQIDPAELAPGAFIEMVRLAVEKDGVTFVLIDSLNGYLNAMSQERFLITQMHELFSFLNLKGVLTLLVVSQNGLLGASVESPIDISYLADSVLLLRYFEAQGEVRKALSVVKKRSGPHEMGIREFRLTNHGVEVGEPLREFQGVLTGNPIVGSKQHLLGENDVR